VAKPAPGARNRKGTRAFVAKSPRAEIVIGNILDQSIQDLISSVAGEVIQTIESIVKETRNNAYDHWYDNVRKVTGRSQAGLRYKVVLKGDAIQGVVYNDATAPAFKRDQEGNKAEKVMEKYGYFVHRPRALSTIARPIPLPEYRALMSFYRSNGKLPPGYVAASYRDSRGRNRPVGIAKIEPNPAASDGKRLWQVYVTNGSKPIIKRRLVELDRAIDDVGKRITR